MNTDGNCQLALYANNKARLTSYLLVSDPCDDYEHLFISTDKGYDPSYLQPLPIFCNIDTQNHLASSATIPSCSTGTQSSLYTVESYRALEIGTVNNTRNFALATVDVTILPTS